ncbi:unnamed protein product [Pylaiella littoralis]
MTAVGIDADETSYGVALSGKYKLSSGDDIRFMVNTGQGMGRYTALNAANGAVITADGDLEAIDSTGYAIAYRHLWNDKMRNASYFQHWILITTLLSPESLSVTRSSYSAS